jgi:hypothetical protein
MWAWRCRESRAALFGRDALLIRDGECNRRAKQESYFCACSGMGKVAVLAPGWRDRPRPAVHARLPHLRAFYTRCRCRRALYLRYLRFIRPSFATGFTWSNSYSYIASLLRIITRATPVTLPPANPVPRRISA